MHRFRFVLQQSDRDVEGQITTACSCIKAPVPPFYVIICADLLTVCRNVHRCPDGVLQPGRANVLQHLLQFCAVRWRTCNDGVEGRLHVVRRQQRQDE